MSSCLESLPPKALPECGCGGVGCGHWATVLYPGQEGWWTMKHGETWGKVTLTDVKRCALQTADRRSRVDFYWILNASRIVNWPAALFKDGRHILSYSHAVCSGAEVVLKGTALSLVSCLSPDQVFDSYPVLHVCLKVRDFLGFVWGVFFLWVISEGPQLDGIAFYLVYVPEAMLIGKEDGG